MPCCTDLDDLCLPDLRQEVRAVIGHDPLQLRGKRILEPLTAVSLNLNQSRACFACLLACQEFKGCEQPLGIDISLSLSLSPRLSTYMGVIPACNCIHVSRDGTIVQL